MEHEKWKLLSRVSLALSILPLATFIPVILGITLPEGVSTAWAGVNIAGVAVGLICSAVCVSSRERRSFLTIVSMLISVFWCLLMAGIVAMALFLDVIR